MIINFKFKAGGDKHFTEEMLEAAYNRLSEEERSVLKCTYAILIFEEHCNLI